MQMHIKLARGDDKTTHRHKAKISQGLRKARVVTWSNHQHQSDKISKLQKAQLQG